MQPFHYEKEEAWEGAFGSDVDFLGWEGPVQGRTMMDFNTDAPNNVKESSLSDYVERAIESGEQ